MTRTELKSSDRLTPDKRRLFIGAYGFEDRSLGWVESQEGDILKYACVFRYLNPKGRNKIADLRKHLKRLGAIKIEDVNYKVRYPHNIERRLLKQLENVLPLIDEVVVDISAMTKLLIMVCLYSISRFQGTVRIVYSENTEYAPTKEEYKKAKEDMAFIAKFPSQGFESIIRMKCLSSIRMQGQPVTLVAFTSFNEQLVRNMLGTINPHRLIFIGCRPPRSEFRWREYATQEIHEKYIEEYKQDNPLDSNDLLQRAASTLNYRDTIDEIESIHDKYGYHERIICAATGSKMQTVGLYFAKMAYPEIHIEYPTPDSYYVKDIEVGIRAIHEIKIDNYSNVLARPS